MIRLALTSLLLLSMIPVSANVAEATPGQGEMDATGLVVNQTLAEALKRETVVRIEITLDLTEELANDLEHPAMKSSVHPVVFDIAMMASQGPMQLDPAGKFHLFRLAASTPVVDKISKMKEVVAMHLDTKPLEEEQSLVKKSGDCLPTSYRACVQNGYFGVTVSYGGVAGKVAAVSSESATFWTYGSSNWEVLAKVIKGCGINNHYWLFAAAAGGSSYSVHPIVFAGVALDLGYWNASNAPVVDLQLFSCS